MILMLFLYDPLYASSHDLESDYPWSGIKDENSPTSELFILKLSESRRGSRYPYKGIIVSLQQSIKGKASLY